MVGDQFAEQLLLKLPFPEKNPLFGMSAELSDDCRYSLFRGKVRLYHAQKKVPAGGGSFRAVFKDLEQGS